jgi:hypothetical protein
VELPEYVITKYGVISLSNLGRSNLKTILYRFRQDKSNVKNFMALFLVICFQKWWRRWDYFKMRIIIYLLLFELDQIKKMRIIGLNVTNRMQKTAPTIASNF